MITADQHFLEMNLGFGSNWQLEVSEQTKDDTCLYNIKLIC